VTGVQTCALPISVERGKEFRFSQLSTPDGFDQIIWLKLTSMKKILIEFK
jgi:hypothetical protein